MILEAAATCLLPPREVRRAEHGTQRLPGALGSPRGGSGRGQRREILPDEALLAAWGTAGDHGRCSHRSLPPRFMSRGRRLGLLKATARGVAGPLGLRAGDADQPDSLTGD